MTLHVERRGRGRDLVLVHGWGFHGGIWKSLANDLAGSWRMHIVDLPGHGRSSAVALKDLPALADALSEVIPRDAVVCAWSLGGLAALALADRSPESIRALVLAGCNPCFVQRPDWPHAMGLEAFDAFEANVRRDAGRALADFARLNAVNGARAVEMVQVLTGHLREVPLPATPSLLAGLDLLRRCDLRPRLPQLGVPTVILQGGRDAIVPAEAGRWLAKTLPSARLVELPDAAHAPFVTHREAIVAAISSLDV